MKQSTYITQGRQAGYTLLEVLIALLVFSIGLLGLAAMLVSAVRGNHQAYYRTQAVYTASAMAEGMRSNLAGVNDSAYDTDGFINSSPAQGCTVCTAAQVAERDLNNWTAMASQRLPNAAINIQCESDSTMSFPAAGFDGVCTLQVQWSEVGDVGQQEDASTQVFSWMMQP